MNEIDDIYVLINSVLEAMKDENIYDKYTLTTIDHDVRSYVILISKNEVKMSKSDFYKLFKCILNNMEETNKFDNHTIEIFKRRFIRKKKYYEWIYQFI